MSETERLVPRFCLECLKVPCECKVKDFEKKRKEFEKQVEELVQKKKEIDKKKLDELMRYTDKYGTTWVKYYDVKKVLEEL